MQMLKENAYLSKLGERVKQNTKLINRWKSLFAEFCPGIIA